jgi:cysteine synthase A
MSDSSVTVSPHSSGARVVASAPDVAMDDVVVDQAARDRSVERFREKGIRLPTFAELRTPDTIEPAIIEGLSSVDRNVPDARNLFRVHWHNDEIGRRTGVPVDVPGHIELPKELTGVQARIVLVFGDRFPMITAHKVLAAYGCLAPRVVTGTFDPTVHRAIWPSTGNYARGGVAISRIMDSHGVAVLPAGMSQERFDWLERWTLDPANDIIRTPGTESNVKEIYDACAELSQVPGNVVINQFCEFANYLVHRTVTGPALVKVFEHLTADRPGPLRGFASATGSAGTIAAGDHLKETYGTEIIAAEALECPTMLENGFGEHNIQGIGDKHIPLIHNVQNTDVVTAISDAVTDQVDSLFQTDVGRSFLIDDIGLDLELVDQLRHFGYSSIANMASAIAFAKLRQLGPDDMVITVATDGAGLYDSGRQPIIDRDFGGTFTAADAEQTFARHLSDPSVHTLLDLDEREKRRIFNLGYFTWVEQQNLSVADFEARREQSWWDGLVPTVEAWDGLINDFNDRTGLG